MSFQTKIFKLEAELRENFEGKSPQGKGQIIHQNLAEHIENGSRSGAEGQLLKEIEEKFTCNFFKAEVSICGYSTKKIKGRFL